MGNRKTNRQARLRLVVSNEISVGYKSGRSLWRDTPETFSIDRTRSAGTRPNAIQPETVPCDLKPRSLAKAVCPPTLVHASNSASLHMLLINAQTGNHVNAVTGNGARDNRRMAKQPTLPASAFWKRLEQALGDKPSWQPLNSNSVATKLGMSQGSVHRWYLGTGLPELQTALDLAKAGGVCVDWLLNNVKPKHPISSDPVLKELFEICEDLNAVSRQAVLGLAQGELLKKQHAEFNATESAKKKA